jgi:large subunit ribosomal protein L18
MANDSRAVTRERRHTRIRRTVVGTAERPRLAIFRSGKHIYAQVIDDAKGATIAAASTLDKDLKGVGDTVAGAKKVGSKIAEKVKSKQIENVVFDRGGFRYHGRIKALADAAREAGLKF